MKIFLLTSLLFFAVGTTHGQSNPDEAVRSIIHTNEKWVKAIIDRDSVVLEGILAPEFSLNGGLPRRDWMNNTLHRLTTSALKTVGEPQVTVYGESALSTSVLYWKASFDGKPMVDGEFFVTDVWKKNNGQWQVLIRMSKPK